MRKTFVTPNRSAAYLKSSRERLGLSVAEMADAIEVSPSTVRRWERDGVTGSMSTYNAYMISRVYEVDIDQLVF